MDKTRAAIQTRWIAERLLWWLLLAAAGFAWYVLGLRLMHWLGPDQLSRATGLMLAVAVVITLWRWSTRDNRRFTIEAGTCPRCYALLTPYEYPPLPGIREQTLRGWQCDNCGLEDIKPLTG